jgi:MFS family permease
MVDRRFTLYLPVLLVLGLSLPLVWVTLYSDFERVRDLADSTVGSSSFFKGISDDKSTTISIIPDEVIDNTIPDTTENVTLTNDTGGQHELVQSTPKGSLTKGLINAAIIVGLAVCSAFGLFFLFRQRRKLTLKMIFAVAIWLCASLSIFLYLYMIQGFSEGVLGMRTEEGALYYMGLLLAGFIIGTIIVYNMVFRSLISKRKNPALLAFSVLLGPFLAVVLPISIVIFLLAGISLWDLWAAKRGIIKKIVTESEEQRKEVRKAKKLARSQTPSPISIAPTKPKRLDLLKVHSEEDITSYGLYEGKHYSLGIGDFIFFSLLASTAFTWFMLKMPWMGFYLPFWGEVIAILFTIVVVGAIMLGLKKTLSYLDKDSIMPGLPLSVLWGLIAFFASAVFLQIVNAVFYGGIVNPF